METTMQPLPAEAGQPALNATTTMPASEPYGVANFFAQGDAVTLGVALILIAMSVLSWTQIALKSWRAWQRKRQQDAVETFWQAATLEEAVTQLAQDKGNRSFAELARQAAIAATHYETHGNKTIGGAIDRSEFLTRALRQSIVKSTARLESGLTMLASVGSIAPFVGLFGTVWGIYHALIAIAATGSASIDKVSGPVGEALIMTAAGLFVAIPAVFAYNAFTRLNRVELSELDGFAHDLHAYLNTGARMSDTVKPPIRVVERS